MNCQEGIYSRRPLDDGMCGGDEGLQVERRDFPTLPSYRGSGRGELKCEKNNLPPEPKNLVKISLFNIPVMLNKPVNVNFKYKVLY